MAQSQRASAQPLRVGIGGPVGSGKTALTLALCKRLRDKTRSTSRRWSARRSK